MGVLAFLIWIFGLLMVVFWVVGDDLVVGGCFFWVVGGSFLKLWRWLMVVLMAVF